MDPPKKLNVTEQEIQANIRSSRSRCLVHLVPSKSEVPAVALIGGGPTLTDSLEELRALDVPKVTVNGSHDWLLDQGMVPDMHVMVDARPQNARFLNHPQEGTKYFLASQCHPDLFDALFGYDVTLFELDKLRPGTSVMLRAISLMRVLGYDIMHLFGMDSCHIDGKHHAYPQPENDNWDLYRTEIRGKNYIMDAANIHQAREYERMVEELGDRCTFKIHGNGFLVDAISYLKPVSEVPDEE